MTLSLISTAFEHGGRIPAKYTCDGENISPPLAIAGVPAGAMALALLMDDPDIPQFAKDKFNIEVFDHWTLFNIPPETTRIPEGEDVGTPGVHSAGKHGYTGPCPPPQYAPSEHRYFFRLYALDTAPDLSVGTTKGDVLIAMQGHILAEAELIGRYSRG